VDLIGSSMEAIVMAIPEVASRTGRRERGQVQLPECVAELEDDDRRTDRQRRCDRFEVIR